MTDDEKTMTREECERALTHLSPDLLWSMGVREAGVRRALRATLDREAALLAEVERLTRERDEARAQYAFMVERAADARLDGYRELADRAASAENDRDRMMRERDEWRERHEVLGVLAEAERDEAHARGRREGAEAMRAAAMRAIDERAPASGAPGWSWYADAREVVEAVALPEEE